MNKTLTQFGKVAAFSGFALALTAGLIVTSAKAQAPAPAPAPAPLTGTWNIDPTHTDVTFAITHFGISTVRGRFNTVSGTIIADAGHPDKSSVNFTIDAASVDTNEPDRDKDLRGDGYFDTAKYPQITFVSTSVKKSGKGKYLAVGDLTIHGVTKSVSLPFTLNGPIVAFGGSRIGVETSTKIERLDYGVGPNLPIIGNDVDIAISLEATPAKG